MLRKAKALIRRLDVLPAIEGRENQGQTGLDEANLAKFLTVALQLGLVLLVIHLFNIEETNGFVRLAPLIFFGFLIHAWLPRRYRLPFFLALSLAGIGVLLGIKQGVGLVGLGLILIGICHLPIAFSARIGLLLLAAGGLAALRAGWIQTFWAALPTLILPILGAMFMFRLIIYLYDLRHEKKSATIWERLSYFFLLPNVCFLLFPVVDYQTFRRTYYNDDPYEIYQKGVLWMLRGVVHLLLYRLVYHHLVLSPSDVQGLGGLAQYVVTTYLLYLRISGQFHLIVGLLGLFGFNLPETHHLYYLASSFNDFWRRINIYWKDFMMKVFYYPVFMRLRRWGMTTGLVGATAVVFAGTWLLHSYQWFWLRGTFPLRATDALFWGILGLLVVVNSLWEARSKKKHSLGQRAWAFREALVHSAKTVGMFVLISLLWSLWSSPSIGEWVSLVSAAGASGGAQFGVLLLVLAVLVVGGAGILYLTSRGWQLLLVGQHPSFVPSAIYTSTAAVLLLGFSMPTVHNQLFGEQGSTVLASIQEERLNQRDAERMERGYYEGLLETPDYLSALMAIQAQKPEGWEPIMESEAVRPVDGLLDYELIPSYEGTFKHALFQTNQWGMHDKEYTMEKPPGTYRIAMIGASYQMGAGVDADQTFEAVLEQRLNTERPLGEYGKYEILNFAVGGYSVVQNVVLSKEKVSGFAPDIVFHTFHATEDQRLIMHLTNTVQEEKPIPYPDLREIIRQQGVTPDMVESEIRKRLDPTMDEVIQWSFAKIAEACRKHNVKLVGIYVPTTREIGDVRQGRFNQLSHWAREAGYDAVWNLEGAYGEHDEASIQLAPWDQHLNARGHRLVADRLYEVLTENKQVFDVEAPERVTEQLQSTN